MLTGIEDQILDPEITPSSNSSSLKTEKNQELVNSACKQLSKGQSEENQNGALKFYLSAQANARTESGFVQNLAGRGLPLLL